MCQGAARPPESQGPAPLLTPRSRQSQNVVLFYVPIRCEECTRLWDLYCAASIAESLAEEQLKATKLANGDPALIAALSVHVQTLSHSTFVASQQILGHRAVHSRQ